MYSKCEAQEEDTAWTAVYCRYHYSTIRVSLVFSQYFK